MNDCHFHYVTKLKGKIKNTTYLEGVYFRQNLATMVNYFGKQWETMFCLVVLQVTKFDKCFLKNARVCIIFE